jgi:hypothetical protein
MIFIRRICTRRQRKIRANGVFGYFILELAEANLSVEDKGINLMKPFQVKGNPYLQLSNADHEPVYIEIYNMSVQLVLTKVQFEVNTINLVNYTSGLYFVRLSDLNNQRKTLKLLLN